ncbi:hypothetical protein BC833DRAFT_574833 [Globomyces pollinis-pini]|nr:hypothetical protein BC833DRAFT_574833 [Globomyces pollinis-pini]
MMFILTLLQFVNIIHTVQSKSFQNHFYLHESGSYKTQKKFTYGRQKYQNKLYKNTTQISTASFDITFSCTQPFGYDIGSKLDICAFASNSIISAAKTLEASVHLPTPVRVILSFRSFCSDSSGNPGTPCKSPSSTLGYARPYGLHQFTNDVARSYGLDPAFTYPSALVRQYVPDDPDLNAQAFDITSSFNSDYNWYYQADPRNRVWDSAQIMKDGFYNQSSTQSFDFEQVVLHEFIHGLGFVSSWGVWSDIENLFLPAFLDQTDDGTIVGIQPSYIINKALSDSVNRVWITAYADIIAKSFEQALRDGGQEKWMELFEESVGGKVGKSLAAPDGLFRTPNALYIWFPGTDQTSKLQFAVLNTPSTFSPGSSITHLDSDVYRGISSYLMRPSATQGLPLRNYIPYQTNTIGRDILGILRSIGYITRY